MFCKKGWCKALQTVMNILSRFCLFYCKCTEAALVNGMTVSGVEEGKAHCLLPSDMDVIPKRGYKSYAELILNLTFIATYYID